MKAIDLAQRLEGITYFFLAANFIFGLYSVLMCWVRVKNLSFKTILQQEEFLGELLDEIKGGRYETALELCNEDERALPKLASLAISNRDVGIDSVRALISEVLQRDVLGDLDRITGWIGTVIKSGPLLGLFGTVLGMMAAFGRIGTGEKVQTSQIADEISIALICTAMGLATAIPFNYFLANFTVRIFKLRDSLTAGLGRIFEQLRKPQAPAPGPRQERENAPVRAFQ